MEHCGTMASPSPVSYPDPFLPSPMTADARCVVTATTALNEIWLYLSGSHRSRLRQLEALRDLDERLRRDVGLPPRVPQQADPWPSHGW